MQSKCILLLIISIHISCTYAAANKLKESKDSDDYQWCYNKKIPINQNDIISDKFQAPNKDMPTKANVMGAYYTEASTGYALHPNFSETGYIDGAKAAGNMFHTFEFGKAMNTRARISLSMSFNEREFKQIRDDEDASDELPGGTPSSITMPVKTTPMLLNFHYTIGDFNNFKPYIMAGVGLSKNTTKSYIHLVPSADIAIVVDGASHYSPAFTSGIGVLVNMTDRLDLDISLRYINFGIVKTSNVGYVSGYKYISILNKEIEGSPKTSNNDVRDEMYRSKAAISNYQIGIGLKYSF